MLIIMKNWNIQLISQSSLDFEAPGSRNILKVDTAKSRRDRFHHRHNLFWIFRSQTDGKGIHPSKLLEEHGFAFHDRHGRLRPDVSETQNSGAVCDHGD